MSWNHRIVKHVHELGGEPYPTYGLHEVFYDDAGKPGSWTKEPVAIVGDSFKDAAEIYMQMSAAFMKPILAVVEDGLVETEEEWIEA